MPGQLTPDEVDASLLVVQDAFRAVRPLIVERAGKARFVNKHDGSPLTDDDVAVEKRVIAALRSHSPGVPVFGEESGYDENVTGTFWLIDPIDGTKSFVENVPAYTSMAVLIQGGEAVASVIYNQSRGDMYVAQKGRGAYKNEVRLDLRTKPLPKVAYCKEQFIGVLNRLLESKGVVCESGPAGGGYGFTMVAGGRAAARFNLLGRGHIHDYAPGALLVREAGGIILPVQDGAYTYKTRSFIACHPDLEATLRPHVQKLRALELELAGKSSRITFSTAP